MELLELHDVICATYLVLVVDCVIVPTMMDTFFINWHLFRLQPKFKLVLVD